MKRSIPMCAALGLLLAIPAHADKMPSFAVSGGGGKSQNAEYQHFSAIVGMAVGSGSANGQTAHHGFLAGARVFASRDEEPPTFDPPPGDIVAAVPDDACVAQVRIPPIRVTDNRDRAPTISAELIDPPEVIDPAGDLIALPPGSYDVLVTATDRNGNEAETAFRIDVVDRTPPAVRPIPNPTPAGQEAQAISPQGTPVAFDFGCVDACDPNPTLGAVPARYPVGDTRVPLTCTDDAGNAGRTEITVRVRDTRPPTVVGQIPANFGVDCNDAAGARIPVPQLVWSDNGHNNNTLTFALTVDPGTPGEQRFAVLPAQLLLSVGPHVLRYTATDPSGNAANAELRVTVTDNAGPRIQVLDLPQAGWYSGAADDVAFSFRVIDDCGNAENLAVAIVPPPTRVQRQGDTVTVHYEDDGLYQLAIQVTDQAGNVARDNSVAFGIDRTPPAATIAVPSQRGVDPLDRLTWRYYGIGETLAINSGGEDDADGTVSGIRRITVTLDPGTARERVLTDMQYPGNGAPRVGARAVGNLPCTDNNFRDPDAVCDNDGQIVLRRLRPGDHTLGYRIEDFAGNIATDTATFVNTNLGAGMELVAERFSRKLASPQPPAGAAQLLGAVRDLRGGLEMANTAHPGSPFSTAIFLGGALRATQNAVIKILRAADAAAGPERLEDLEQANLLARLAISELSLYNEWITTLDPARGREAFYRSSFNTDQDIAGDHIINMGDAINAEDYNQALASAMEGFFHLKMAHELWVMDYHRVPNPVTEAGQDMMLAEYARGRDVLADLLAELTTYISLEDKPAGDPMQNIQARLRTVVDDLTILVEEGFDGDGLTDREYLNALIELQSIARNSTLAANQGAYVRTYQWSIMQVVRWMTHASLETARLFTGYNALPLFQVGYQSINTGVDLLDAREVQGVIDLYSSDSDALCPIIGVYHCWYLIDEENDLDRPYPTAQTPPACFNHMLRSEQWAAAPAEQYPPECRFTPGVANN